MVSLLLSLLLWLNGLLESLERPSVGNDLSRRQLELSALAAPAIPPSLQPLLVGEDPGGLLLAELEQQAEEGGDSTTASAAAQASGEREARISLLERALLQLRQGQPAAARPLLLQLQLLASADDQALIEQLLMLPQAGTMPAEALGMLEDPLVRRLSCQVLANSSDCGEPAAERRALLQLLGINLLPALALLVGLVLLLREGWLRWRGKQQPLPGLVGPDLGVIDVVLLIAGGFVLLGEVLTPVLLSPLLQATLSALAIKPPLADGVTVLAMYLGLMAAPLLMLFWLLRSRGEAPQGGWLQFRWRPVGSALRKSLKYLLIVLPLVALVGWLQQLVWSDIGGSNPLLELVLRSGNGLTLACFAFTAIVLAPLFEETIFRGVLLPVLGRELGPLSAVLLSSAVFGIAHLSLGEFPPLFTLGLGLGWLRLSSGRLSTCVGLHALWNGLTFANLLLLAR
ncbi:CPBP family intramembrane metalloprotease [Synechococcus sp. Cruz-9H2]|uniref:CPBP family intramembrane glutamic endopeptidase n=1 Tax=unclassified Synechococcus TaxID=2626047 RepID=UPI0020CD6D4C|nr:MULTISPECIES: CPBP family intramembrane glutamic endopeptidase [unclassified Synechococcus]MCP9818223.1 CPBP family intramembrane metalloprotease [Synechococcus sp. Cruz-9H2]MCP9842277.1 CPBP family intramembrane metalloprotease [Synechococcus sp. Edmonson 11F2]MCP9854619.1 CPBP family intramembrane metalloprotease [Synechococcus sp. Cruz-9C9]MCP9861685.1 CPBP family intramembrane metalloprotease [Synechococcus sp. Cruz-7E5]MCP9869131.1 CPBP family intramembrane metalloprotease [Synechococc